MVKVFGHDIVDPTSQQIDRKKIAERIFGNRVLEKKLNYVTHKYIGWLLFKRILWRFIVGSKVVVLDAPLLIESGLYRICHIVALVTIPDDIQLVRLMHRDALDQTQANNRINAQMPTKDKLKYATHVIDNSGPIEEVPKKVAEVMLDIRKKNSWVSRELLCLLLLLSVTFVFRYFFGA